MGKKKPRATRMTVSEQRWIRILKESSSLDLTEPFRATQAIDALLLYRNPRSKLPLHNAPNKYRLNYVLKKSGEFTCIKDSGNRNYWKLREVR